MTTANDLCATLSQPGVKWCLMEYFDYNMADHLLQAPKEILCDDHRKKLEKVHTGRKGGRRRPLVCECSV
jgi:hypothetical protein